MTPALAVFLVLAALLVAAEPPVAPLLSPPPPPAADCAMKLAVMAPCLAGAATATAAAAPPSNACCEAFRSASLGGVSSCLCQLAKNPDILGLPLSRVAFTFHSCGGAASAAAVAVNHTCGVRDILPDPTVPDAPTPPIRPQPPKVIHSGATRREIHVLVVAAAVLLLLC